MGTVIDAVLCDVDGVLRRWDPDAMSTLDRAYGLPAGSLVAAAFAPTRLRPAITGQVTDEEWRLAVEKDLSAALGSRKLAANLVAEWSHTSGQVNEDVLELLGIFIPKDIPVLLVSNGTTRLESDLAKLGLAGSFDGVVNSARIGVAKPDVHIFRIAARRVGVSASRCLFIDDMPENVETACNVGMVGHLYTGVPQLRARLTSLIYKA